MDKQTDKELLVIVKLIIREDKTYIRREIGNGGKIYKENKEEEEEEQN